MFKIKQGIDIGSSNFVDENKNVFANDVTVAGNLVVNGTTTTINTTTLTVDDKNIELGSVTTPTDTTADGGGITLKGATDKTIVWNSTNSNWTSSEHWNLASGKTFKINNVTVLSATAVGALDGSQLTNLNASNLSSGTVSTARLGTGTANNTTYLRGDGTWATVTGGGATISAADTSSTYYIPMSATTSGTWTDARVDSTDMYFSASTATLYVTNFNSASDERLKSNIETIESGLDVINKMRGVSFTWNSTNRKSYGVIAQEIEQLLPDIVDDVENRKTVNYNALIGFLIEAVKELSQEVSKLKGE